MRANNQTAVHASDTRACIIIWPLGLNHSTSRLEKSERARRRNETDNRLFVEFSSIALGYCKISRLDDAQRKEFSRDVLGFLYDKQNP